MLDAERARGVGTQPPVGYMQWHYWAERQHRAGLRQRRCPICKLWRFPQEKCCAALAPPEEE